MTAEARPSGAVLRFGLCQAYRQGLISYVYLRRSQARKRKVVVMF